MSTARFDTLQNAAGSKSVPVSTVVDGSAKAWVNFNGTGTVAIRAAFNVGSITDNGTGNYTVNFTSALADANYAAAVGGVPVSNRYMAEYTTHTTTQLQVGFVDAANGAFNADCATVSVAVFR